MSCFSFNLFITEVNVFPLLSGDDLFPDFIGDFGFKFVFSSETCNISEPYKIEKIIPIYFNKNKFLLG